MSKLSPDTWIGVNQEERGGKGILGRWNRMCKDQDDFTPKRKVIFILIFQVKKLRLREIT